MEDHGYQCFGYLGTVRWKMEQIQVICGIPDVTISTGLVERISQMALEKETQLIIHPCLSKQEVEYKVFSMDKRAKAVILLQENMDTSASYQAWEIASLRDIRRIPVVVSVDRKHYGTDYMAVLYAAGITDAVYEEEADAGELTKRILSRRSRKDCREYYGIKSMDEVVSVLDILGKDTLDRYIHYISAGIDAEDTHLRYQEVRKKLSYVENCCLAEHLPESILQELQADEELASYQKTVQKTKKEREKKMGAGHLRAGLKMGP